MVQRAASVGQQWSAEGSRGVIRHRRRGHWDPAVTMTAFGPTLLSKALGLNDTEESSLGLVFHYADQAGLALLDLADLREVVKTSPPTRARPTGRTLVASTARQQE